MRKVGELIITAWESSTGTRIERVPLSYELAGAPLGEAPIVLVNHALTGNSHVAGPDGWWAELIGPGQAIDTERYTILCFDIPGNCYHTEPLPEPNLFTLREVAELMLQGLKMLGIQSLHAIIGASMGGALVWQIAHLAPSLANLVIPIACDYRASDWLLGQTLVQRLLLESEHPLYAARIHGMLCYRTPESINQRFGGEQIAKGEEGETKPKVLDWLEYHGRQLESRFSLDAYKVMTHLTETIHVTDHATALRSIEGEIHMISIDSDLLFPHSEAVATAEVLGVPLHTIHSIHGHDAFLMEYQQLSQIINSFFHQ